jgi:hypothetical protein
VELEGTRVRINSKGAWRLAGGVGKAAGVALQVWSTVSMIDDALTRIEKAQTGSVGPEVAKAIAAVQARFAPPDAARKERFSHFNEDRDYPEASDWLSANAWPALAGNDKKQLDAMGDHLNTVYWYAQKLEDLEQDHKPLYEALVPLHKEVTLRHDTLSNIAETVLSYVAKMPSETAQVTLFGIYQTFDDARHDMARLESAVAAKESAYKQALDRAHKERLDAAVVFNFWAPSYAKKRPGARNWRLSTE